MTPLPISDLHKRFDIYVLSSCAVSVTLYFTAVTRMQEREHRIYTSANVPNSDDICSFCSWLVLKAHRITKR
jgi:hypothetical protein